METQLTCFSKKHTTPALCPHFHRDTERLQFTGDATRPRHLPTDPHVYLRSFEVLSFSQRRTAIRRESKTPSVHFNMNVHVSSVLPERRRCEIADGVPSGPDTQG